MENNSLCTATPYPAKENRKGAPYAIFIWRVKGGCSQARKQHSYMNDMPSWGVNVGVMIDSRRYLDNY